MRARRRPVFIALQTPNKELTRSVVFEIAGEQKAMALGRKNRADLVCVGIDLRTQTLPRQPRLSPAQGLVITILCCDDEAFSIGRRQRLVFVSGAVNRRPEVFHSPKPSVVRTSPPDIGLAQTSRPAGAEIEPTIRTRARKPFGRSGIDRFGQPFGSTPMPTGIALHSPDVQIPAMRTSRCPSRVEIQPSAVGCVEWIGFKTGCGERWRPRVRPSGVSAAAQQKMPTREFLRTANEEKISRPGIKGRVRLEQRARNSGRSPVRGILHRDIRLRGYGQL